MRLIGFIMLQLISGGGLHAAKDYTNWNLLNYAVNGIISNFTNQEDFVKDKCLIKLIEEAVNQFGSTYVFISDDHDHEELLRNLQINFLHSFFTEPNNLIYSESESFYNLLIFCNKFKLREVIKRKKPFQGTKFFIMVKNYDEAVQKFEILWESRLVNVVASFIENSTVYYYTYFPYCATHCGRVGKPYLLGKCDVINGIFSHREKLFPRKVYDLHKCPINVTFIENVPSSYYTETKKLTGWEIELVNEILERLNGIPNFNEIQSKNRVYKASHGYRLLVKNSEIGIGLLVSLKGLVKTDFGMYGMSLCTTWIVPKKEGSSHSVDFLVKVTSFGSSQDGPKFLMNTHFFSPKKNEKVFPPSAWLLLLLAYFIMASVFRMLFKSRYCNILFKLLPFLLGTTTRTKRISKRLGALWLWFCLIINAFYLSGFQSTLLVPDFPKQLSTTKEILESNLKILGVSDIISDAFPYFKKRFNLSRKRFLLRKFSYKNWVYRMTVQKDSAFLGFKEITQYHIERTELANKIYIPEHCIFKYHLAFVLKKNSHLTEIVVKLSNRLNENGFLAHFIRKHLSRESRQNIPIKVKKIIKPLKDSKCNAPPPPFNMNKMFVVLKGLACGFTIGFMTFLIEITSSWNLRRIKANVVNKLQFG